MNGDARVVLYAYADGEDEYLFVPEWLWEERSRVMQAFFTARTWGEVWSLMPESEAARLRRMLGDAAAEAAPEDAARFPPSDEDTVDWSVIPLVREGEYPDQLMHLTAGWCPRELMGDLQGVSGMPVGGWNFGFRGDGGPLPEVEAVFARHGVRLVWDPERVMKASGWYWHDLTRRR